MEINQEIFIIQTMMKSVLSTELVATLLDLVYCNVLFVVQLISFFWFLIFLVVFLLFLLFWGSFYSFGVVSQAVFPTWGFPFQNEGKSFCSQIECSTVKSLDWVFPTVIKHLEDVFSGKIPATKIKRFKKKIIGHFHIISLLVISGAVWDRGQGSRNSVIAVAIWQDSYTYTSSIPEVCMAVETNILYVKRNRTYKGHTASTAVHKFNFHNLAKARVLWFFCNTFS